MDNDQAKLFVGGILGETSEDTLRDYFGKYGTVLGSVIATDRVTRNPRGFGFVTFSDPSSAAKALLDSHVILGRTVVVKRAIPRGEQPKKLQQSNGNINSQIRTRKIFVGGLSSTLSEEDFKRYFERFGRINDVVVMHDSTTRRPRGFGFITFDSEDSVENVMQNSFHVLSGRLVEVKRAVPKEEIGGNGGFLTRNGGGVGFLPDYRYPYAGNYASYGPVFDVPPSPTFSPFMGYASPGGFVYGTSDHDGWYSLGGFGGVSYGFAPIVPGYGPRMNGLRACVLPYGSSPFYPPMYVDGLGGNNGVVRPGFGGKWNEVVVGVGHAPANLSPLPRQSEGVKVFIS